MASFHEHLSSDHGHIPVIFGTLRLDCLLRNAMQSSFASS